MFEDNLMLKPESFKRASFFFKSTQCKFMTYTRYIPRIFMGYAIHILVLAIFIYVLPASKGYAIHVLVLAIFMFYQLSNDISGHKRICSQKASFSTRQDIPSIYQVNTMHIPCKSHLQAFLVAHQRLPVDESVEDSDWDFTRIFSVLATERPPTRGWGRPKFNNQVLIS
jgi:hypothetical protein